MARTKQRGKFKDGFPMPHWRKTAKRLGWTMDQIHEFIRIMQNAVIDGMVYVS